MLVLAVSKNCSPAASMSEPCSSSSSSSSSTCSSPSVSNLAGNSNSSSNLLSSSPNASASSSSAVDANSYPCDDIWKKFDDFLLTPPQSPPVNLDDTSFDPLLDDALSVVMNDLHESSSSTVTPSNHHNSIASISSAIVYEPTGPIEFLQSLQGDDTTTNVLRDCMWSGACVEDCMQTNSLCQLALLDSSFNQILACHNDTLAITSGATCADESDDELEPSPMDVEEEVEDSEESEDEPYSRIITVSDSLLDHSYGTSSHIHSRVPFTSTTTSQSSSGCAASTSPMTPSCTSSARSSTSSQGSISLIEPSSKSKKLSKKQQQQHSTVASSNNVASSSSSSNSLFSSTSNAQMTNCSLRPQRQRVPKKRKDELLTPVSVKFVKSRILTPPKEPIMKHKIVCRSPQRKKNTIASLSLSCNNSNSNNNSKSSSFLSSSSSLSPCASSSSRSSSPTLSSTSTNCFQSIVSTAAASALSPSSCSQSSMSSNCSSSSMISSSTPYSSSTSVLSSYCSGTSLLRSKHKNLPPERRRDHNDNEKKRRDQLRGAFHCLRDQVPKLKDSNRKPPRIVILHEASSYVKTLLDKQKELDRVKKAELARNQKLLKKLASLRSYAA